MDIQIAQAFKTAFILFGWGAVISAYLNKWGPALFALGLSLVMFSAGVLTDRSFGLAIILGTIFVFPGAIYIAQRRANNGLNTTGTTPLKEQSDAILARKGGLQTHVATVDGKPVATVRKHAYVKEFSARITGWVWNKPLAGSVAEKISGRETEVKGFTDLRSAKQAVSYAMDRLPECAGFR